jgi:O-antigen ligase
MPAGERTPAPYPESNPAEPACLRWLRRLVLAGLVVHAAFLSISVAGMQIGLGVSLGGLLALRIVSRRPVWARSGLDWPVLIFCGAAVLSIGLAALAGERPVGWHEGTLWRSMVSPIVIVSGLRAAEDGTEGGDRRRRALLVLTVWAVASLVPSALAWVQHYTGLDPLHALGLRRVAIRPPAVRDAGHFAAAGFFHWYQRLAHDLTPPLFLAAGLAAYGPLPRRQRLFFATTAVAAALAVALTTSRLAWVALAGGGLLLGLLGGRRIVRWVLPLAPVALLAAALVLPGARVRMLSAAAWNDNGDRMAIWKVCAAVVHDHPLTGVGWGNLPQRSAPYYARIAAWFPLHAWCHDSFFTALAEGGPLLLLATALYWLLLARVLGRQWRQGDGLSRAAAAGGLAGLAAMLVNSLGHDIFYSSEATYGLGFALGLAVALAGPPEPSPGDPAGVGGQA